MTNCRQYFSFYQSLFKHEYLYFYLSEGCVYFCLLWWSVWIHLVYLQRQARVWPVSWTSVSSSERSQTHLSPRLLPPPLPHLHHWGEPRSSGGSVDPRVWARYRRLTARDDPGGSDIGYSPGCRPSPASKYLQEQRHKHWQETCLRTPIERLYCLKRMAKVIIFLSHEIFPH